MSIKDAIKKFADSVSDLTNLEVTTYSGKLEQAIDASTGQLRWDSFKPNNGKLSLVAATLIRPNMNTVNFRAEALEQGDIKALMELHQAAVESAHNGRLALVKMFSGLLPGGGPGGAGGAG